VLAGPLFLNVLKASFVVGNIAVQGRDGPISRILTRCDAGRNMKMTNLVQQAMNQCPGTKIRLLRWTSRTTTRENKNKIANLCTMQPNY